MDERLFARLAALLAAGPVVVASVLDTRGATPRKGGSRMLVADARTEFSVGGGLAEARVIAAAQALLADPSAPCAVAIDLTGRPGAAGVCGGTMRIALKRWDGAADRARAQALAAALRGGQRVTASAADFGSDADTLLEPDPRLLIVGGGHCGQALYELARPLDFDLVVYDTRAEFRTPQAYPDALRLGADAADLPRALDTGRAVYAVLLNRDYAADVAALRVLCARPPAFLGMMGSSKRIAEVRAALPEYATVLASLHAPIGLDIEAQTPHEIAISILAQLIRFRRTA